jgi:DNA-binding NarL/FixJ family response regulator
MYVLKSAHDLHREEVTSPGSRPAAGSEGPRAAISDRNGAGPQGDAAIARQGAAAGWVRNGAAAEQPTLIYLDPRAFTRDCVGAWLQSGVSGFGVCILSDPNQIETAPVASEQIRAVIINTGSERMASAAVAHLVARVSELLPDVPVAVLSDYEDSENIRQAFELGVRGYIPTSLASMVAIGAVHLVCVGGTFAPTAALLARGGERPQGAAGEPLIQGFTQRQAQILDCLRRGMANKLIAYELNMCESTVKVHVRNIMKKLKATNRTHAVYLTRGLFESTADYQSA